MANEITVTLRVQVANGALVDNFNPGTDHVTQAVMGSDSTLQTIGTSEEVISVHADVATLGWCGFTNTDATNYVEIGPESGGAMVPMIRLNAGESAVMRLKPAIVMRAQANTAAVKLKVWILND